MKKDYKLTEQDIKNIKSVFPNELSANDFDVFLHMIEKTGLDPIARQIYAIARQTKVKKGNNYEWVPVMSIQTSIDGFRLIADRTNCYSPAKPTEFQFNEHGKLLSATAYIKKFAGNVWHEIGETAFLSEYASNTNFWNKFPTTMLAKVAEAKALRRAFPNDLSGLYTDDEMQQSKDVEPVQEVFEVKEEVKDLINKEDLEALQKFLDKDADLKAKILELCKVSDLTQIKHSQKQAIKDYATNYFKRKSEIKANNQ